MLKTQVHVVFLPSWTYLEKTLECSMNLRHVILTFFWLLCVCARVCVTLRRVCILTLNGIFFRKSAFFWLRGEKFFKSKKKSYNKQRSDFILSLAAIPVVFFLKMDKNGAHWRCHLMKIDLFRNLIRFPAKFKWQASNYTCELYLHGKRATPMSKIEFLASTN